MTEEVLQNADDQEHVTQDQGEGGSAAAPADAAAPPDPFEDAARAHGWTPKEEWRGKPEDWRDPREFINYGMKRSRESADELKQLRQSVGTIGKTAEALMRRQVEEARREAEMKFAGAVEAQDHEAARAASEELRRLEQPAQPTVPQDAVSDFMSRNGAWFGSNRAATALARQMTAELAAQGVDPADQLRQAEEAVKAEFPQLFQQRQPGKPAPAVNAPATRAASPSQRAKGFNDLPKDAQKAGHDFVRRGMVKNLEDYARVYLEENA